MAIYHMSVKIISRSSGRSSVGASAYRSGEKLYNSHDGITHDYRKKKDVIYSEILLPVNAPDEFKNRETLWNEVEKIEKRRTSQLSREVEVALPIELNFKKQMELVLNYAKDNFVSKGMCADIAIHDKGEGNPHAHIMLTMRAVDESGKFMPKSRFIYELDKDGAKIYNPKNRQYKGYKENVTDWDNRNNVEVWREDWANKVNTKLVELGYYGDLDHRSFERREIEQFPTIHLGSSASKLEKRGIKTDRGNINREIRDVNNEIESIKAELYLNEIDKVYYSNKKTKEKSNVETMDLKDLIDNLKSQESVIKQLDNRIDSIKSEERSLSLKIDKLISDSHKISEELEIIKSQFYKINKIKEGIEDLKDTHIPIFKNNKDEIKRLEDSLVNINEIYQKNNENYRNKWDIKKVSEKSANEKLSEMKIEYDKLVNKRQELPSTYAIEKEMESKLAEYKKNLVISELREDFAELKKQHIDYSSKNSPNLTVRFGCRISNEDRGKVILELNKSQPELSERLNQKLEENIQKDRHISRGFEMEM